MRLSSMTAVLAACVLILTACSDDGGSDAASGKDQTPAVESTEPDGTEVIEFDDTARKLPPKKVCQALDAADVGKVLGDKVKRSPVVQSTCTFSDLLPQSERSVGISYLQLSAVGGIDAYEQGLGGEPEEVPDLGDGAFVLPIETATGARAVAALVTGNALIQLQVVPGTGASAEEATTVATNLLRLVDARV